MKRASCSGLSPRGLAGAALLCTAELARAHGGAEGSNLSWTLDGWVVGPLAFTLVAFLVGYVRVRRRATAPSTALRPTLLFLGGWLTLVAALVSPLHRAGESSFAAHMLEHELLMLVAAPLLVAAHPGGVLLWAVAHRARAPLARVFLAAPVATTWRRLIEPLTATVLQSIVLWLWHAPPLFDRALASPGWHIVQHLSFVISALIFWSAMLDPKQRHRQPAMLIGCLFATSIVSGALGALMAFSNSPWYAGYRALNLSAFGLAPVQDQQIAGVLMWIPGGLVHLGVALALLAQVLHSESPFRGNRNAT